MMNFIGIIPARYASTRFPGKPLANIGGQTMIRRVYQQASTVLKEVVVATDDERIYNEVTGFGGHAEMTLSSHRSGTDRCAEALLKIHAPQNDTVIINIQGDEPFIQPEQIQKLMDCFQHNAVEIATLVKPIVSHEDLFNPNHVKVVRDTQEKAIYFSRSPIPYLRNVSEDLWHTQFAYYKHIGIYAYRSDVLLQLTHLSPSPLEIAESLEQNRWIENGYAILTAVTDYESVSIDTPEDLAKLPL